MKCDICGKEGEVKEVSPYLKLKGIIDVFCPKCEVRANKVLTKFREMVWRRTRRKMIAMQKAAKETNQ